MDLESFHLHCKQGRKRPLDTPKRIIESEREKEREKEREGKVEAEIVEREGEITERERCKGF